MSNETNTSKTEDSLKARSMEQAEERTYRAIRECMEYQKSLKKRPEDWELEVFGNIAKAQQEARDT